jgi:NAD(P)-dependent dehydrogenase (short-subunit alcohol dehydrogenase family)
MKSIKSLYQKVAIVTGGGSGIGQAIALVLAREGAMVMVTDANATAAADTSRLVQSAGGDTAYLALDVTQPLAHETVVKQTIDHFGALHLACNVAGVSTGRGGYQLLADTDCTDWADVIAVNLSGVFYGMRSQIPALLRSGGGAIVNVASIMGQVAGTRLGPYVASKHGVVGLTKATAVDYARQGIRVNAVGPGYIETPMLGQKDQSTLASLADRHPLGRLGKADEVAETVAWLCSARASFITGAYYPVDGGYLAL